jgi:phosphate acetyltransferase
LTEASDKYDRLIAAARDGTPALTIVAHPCDETSLRGAMEAPAQALIEPVLVGPAARIVAIAAEHGIDIAGREIVDAPHSHAAAAQAVALGPNAEPSGRQRERLASVLCSLSMNL